MNITSFLGESRPTFPIDDRSGCKRCTLRNKKLHSPFMTPHGKFKKQMLIWGEAPGKDEDRKGKQFCGESGDLLKDSLEELNIRMNIDCIKTNAVDCRPPDNRTPTDKEIKNCWNRKRNILDTYQPRVILLFGRSAVRSFYNNDKNRSTFLREIASLRGKCIPDLELNAWICHSNHPSYILRGNNDKIKVFMDDIKLAVSCIDRKRPRERLRKKPFKTFTFNDIQHVKQVLKELTRKKTIFLYDYETSSVRYWEPNHRIHMASFQTLEDTLLLKKNTVYDLPFDTHNYWQSDDLKTITELWTDLLLKGKYIAHNISHEYQANKYFFNVDRKNGFIFDTMLGARTLDEALKTTGLKFQAHYRFGVPNYSSSVDKYIKADIGKQNKFENIEFDKAVEYCCRDTNNTKRLYTIQRKQIKKKRLIKGYKLLHDGSLELADMTDNGIKLDMKLLKELIDKKTKAILEHKEFLWNHRLGKRFKRLTGRKLKIKKKIAPNDLATVVYDIMKAGDKVVTDIGNVSLTEPILNKYAKKSSFIKHELLLRKDVSILGFLANFYKHQWDGYLHPGYLLNTTRSMRGSSANPNFHQVPKHDPNMKIIRRLIVPIDESYVIAEVDYSSMEVRVIACWSKDPVLCDFIRQGFDFHAYRTEKIFRVKRKDIDKKVFSKVRYAVKQHVVFARFYGSFFENIAPQLWNYMIEIKCREWLPRRKDEFVDIIQEDEEDFWRQFKGVKRAQERALKQYKRDGYIKMIGWGFRRHGYLSRNKIFNSHIQGPAFHCLLWSIIEAGKIKGKYKTKFAGQIHDSMFINMYKEEKKEVRKDVDYIMTEKIRKENPWLIVPLETEWEISSTNWANMKEWE